MNKGFRLGIFPANPSLFQVMYSTSKTLPLAVAMCFWAIDLPAATPIKTTIKPCLGTYYRPGAWLRVRATIKTPVGHGGVFVPELHVINPTGGSFVCRLPATRVRESAAYAFTFWAIAGSDAPQMMIQLVGRDRNQVLRGIFHERVISPLPPGKRMVIRPGNLPAGSTYDPTLLPNFPAAYESCDAIVLGAIAGQSSGHKLSPSRLKAISAWTAQGGIVLALDHNLAAKLVAAAAQQGIRASGIFPFVLPRPKRIDEIPRNPSASHIGRGLVIDLSGKDTGHKVRLGRAAWKRIETEFLSARTIDLRLQKRRYQILDGNWPGWPAPPRPATAQLLRWLLAWTALMAAALVASVIRKSPMRTSISACLLSLLLAFAFLQNNPPQALRIVHARSRIVGQTSANGPTLDEDLWLVTPFSSAPGKAISINFHATPPPRMLVYDRNQLASLDLALELGEPENRIIICAPKGKIIGRAFPLLLSRVRLGKSLPVPNLILRESEDELRLILPDTVCGRLEAASLRTRYHNLFMRTFDDKLLPAKSEPQPDTPRTRIMSLLADEHQPGDYATLMGWEPKPTPTNSELGVLRIYGIGNVIRELKDSPKY